MPLASPTRKQWNWPSEISGGYSPVAGPRVLVAGSGHEAVHALAGSRVVITADLDFPRLFALMGAGDPGLILLRGGNYSESESLECVRRVLAAVPEEELPRSIVVVDPERIRRRWLPV